MLVILKSCGLLIRNRPDHFMLYYKLPDYSSNLRKRFLFSLGKIDIKIITEQSVLALIPIHFIFLRTAFSDSVHYEYRGQKE